MTCFYIKFYIKFFFFSNEFYISFYFFNEVITAVALTLMIICITSLKILFIIFLLKQYCFVNNE